MECSCSTCKGACTHKPGWFMPGEAEKAAALQGMSLPDFFRAHLAVDWYERGWNEQPTFVLSPAALGNYRGEEFPGNPLGQCVFYDKAAGCAIHAAKPQECSFYDHTRNGEVPANHLKVADAWAAPEHQAQIEWLLGRPPKASEYENSFSSLFGVSY